MKPQYAALEEEVVSMIENALDDAQVRIHSVTSRVKEFESAVAKLERKRASGEDAMAGNGFIDLKDMVGVRVVALFRDDLQPIVRTVADLFDDCHVDDKVEDFEVSTTGYQSIHVTACLPQAFSGPRYDEIKGLRFEVQIRTIAMDAWASISHHLSYRTESDVPAEQRRSFRALAGLFYVADTEFQALNNMRQGTLAEMSSESETDPSSLLRRPVTADALVAYMRTNDLYEGRRKASPEDAQALAEQLRQADYERLDDVDGAVRQGEEPFLEQDELRDSYDKFTDVGRVRVSLCAVDPKFDALVKGEAPE